MRQFRVHIFVYLSVYQSKFDVSVQLYRNAHLTRKQQLANEKAESQYLANQKTSQE